jgi:excisionase family DNA binding protein
MTSVHQTQLPLDAAAVSSRSTTGHSWEPAALNATAQPVAPRLAPDSEDGVARPASRVAMLLTVRDVEAELQLGRTRTYELLRSGEIPVIRIGRVLRVPRDALLRWIDAKCLTSPMRRDAMLSCHQEPDHRLSRPSDP